MDEALKIITSVFFNYDPIESSGAHVKFEVNIQKREKSARFKKKFQCKQLHALNDIKILLKHRKRHKVLFTKVIFLGHIASSLTQILIKFHLQNLDQAYTYIS